MSLIRIHNEQTGQWNLLNTESNIIISSVWFDDLGKWTSYKINEYDIYGWDGLVFLEEPVYTPKSAYPYSVKAKSYKFTSEGKLIEIKQEIIAGIWGSNVKCNNNQNE